MAIDGELPLRIMRIRRAGLNRVAELAINSGVTPEQLERDLRCLRYAANSGGNANRAAQACRIGRSTACRIIEKYEGYALQILGGIP